jgi:chemotaxis protein MotB
MKKYKELQDKRDKAEVENLKLKDENRQLKTLDNELSSKLAIMEKQLSAIKKDTTNLGKKYRYVAGSYRELSKNYNDLLKKHNDLLAGNEKETKRILSELQQAQADLMRREDSLAVLEKDYTAKKAELDKLARDLAAAQTLLGQKEEAYNELKAEVEKKDSIMNALKNSVSDALSGFENNGLTITRRNGQVYVSMDEKLLFPSGSFTVNAKGKEALIKLAKVLENNKDIKILVEGHTDSIPYRGSGNLKDNWDLSVKRATSIVRVLIANSNINPTQVTAAGRSEYLPVAPNTTKEGRAKNRRTEIILQPNLEKLYQLVK